MDVFKKSGFWVGFAATMLITLLIGGLLSAVMNKCPAFGPLVLISIGVALLGGFAAMQYTSTAKREISERIASEISPRQERARSIEELQQRISAARQQLSQRTLQDRISEASDQIERLRSRLME